MLPYYISYFYNGSNDSSFYFFCQQHTHRYHTVYNNFIPIVYTACTYVYRLFICYHILYMVYRHKQENVKLKYVMLTYSIIYLQYIIFVRKQMKQ